MIETERLLLRLFELKDIEVSYEMNLDTEVSRYTGDGGVVSKEEIERRIKEDVMGDYKKYGFGRFAVELKETGACIGFCGLKFLPDMKETDLGFRFMSEHWGKGYATEAAKACHEYGFNELGLKRIIAMVLPANLGSIRVLEKLGFEYETDLEEDGVQAKLYALDRC